ncbi:hypothetical protein [Kitasatospora sp. NRRL B-11411]|uniref:hypothetical protein n=1 Tax=Kitasatospora sp. NRRL B-11411 TaxID=1463822 RepID=UPI001E42559E|nr:hypothetical protein [Kitasatospora sp. NRRL B-11411]
MSYTARGLLVDLLSRPDDWRETCRQMADSSPQGRKTLAAALDELRAWGYYRVEVIRLPNGRVRSEAHVFDRPQTGLLPGATAPGSGESECGDRGVLPKDLVKEPSLPSDEDPAPLADASPADEEGGREESVPEQTPQLRRAVPPERPEDLDEESLAAVNVLLRAVRPERRLPLGVAEAAALAPLVREWMDRGASQDELRQALLAGLPEVVHSPIAVVRSRLERKKPAGRSAALRQRLAECELCRDPLPEPGLCGSCRGAGRNDVAQEHGAQVTARGMAKVRAAMASSRR